ncbi:hypothetical protein KFK09_002933 [Dendrobium nobile]|uniref:PGG domain-containing protein n=1 Tax=Dendrobium nobile TaxID=94219 RepID=A0A8T3C8M9_DENNO|nr:hypothetical protein KFK09_002933 [Dendrobium nobile]
MVRLLLQANARIAHLLDDHGLSAIHIAASKDHGNVIEEILHHCPDATELTDVEGNNFLHVATKKRATSVVKLVLSNPLLRQSINEMDREGNTPLHLAVMNHNREIIHLLLSDSRVDTNVINRKGLTPLDIASSCSDSSIRLRTKKICEELTSAGSKFGTHRMDILMGKDQRRPEEELNRYRTLASNMAIVAVLIATVTFAAAFTLPGGYNNDESNNQEQGMAILAKKLAFKVFLIFDTISMLSSISVTCLLICTGSLDHDIRLHSIITAMKFMWVALGGMVVAFSMGIYVVLVSKCRWLAVLICGMAACVPFMASFFRLRSKPRVALQFYKADGMVRKKSLIRSPLHMATRMHPSCLTALRAGNMARLRALLQDDPTRFYGITVKGNNILHIAANLGNDWVITKACDESEWDLLLHQNSKGDTIIHCAARAGHDHIISLLIDHGAGLQMTGVLNQRGDSALHEAARGGHAKNMTSMVNEDGESPLYLATVRGSVEIVEMLLGCAMVDYRGPRGQTALHAAVCRSYDITQMLLERMPALNLHADASLSAPIHYAVSLRDVKMVRLLLQANATIAHLLDDKGLSAIHIAASKGYMKVIWEILRHCPDATELTDYDGNNFLHVAAKKGVRIVVRQVLRNPLLIQSINETDHEGNTPLHLAAMNYKWRIVRILLSNNIVDKNVINCKGLTPLDVASSIDASKFRFRRRIMIKKLNSAGTKFGPHRMDIMMPEDQDYPEEELDRHRAMENNLAIVAVLIATVTFAAAFTLPGGYSNDDSNHGQGMAILAKKVAFKVFLISDTIAMASSMCVTFLLISSSSPERDQRLSVIITAKCYVRVALVAMLVAFSMGIYVVVVSQCRWLADLICGMAICSPFIIFWSSSFIKVSYP